MEDAAGMILADATLLVLRGVNHLHCSNDHCVAREATNFYALTVLDE